MSIGIVGIKEGMTRVFMEDGQSVPVTVISAAPNRVTQVKNADDDGYNAIQVTFGSVKQSKVNKPSAGHFAKASVEAGKALKEFQHPLLAPMPSQAETPSALCLLQPKPLRNGPLKAYSLSTASQTQT